MSVVKESGNFVLTVELDGEPVLVTISGLGHFYRREDDYKLWALIERLTEYRDDLWGKPA